MSSKRDIRVLSFENYVAPKRTEETYRNWVLNGVNHSFYEYIIDRKWGSPTNLSILESYSTMTYGKGLGVHEDEGNEAQLEEFLSYMSKKDQKAVISDYCDFGEFSLQIHRQKGDPKKLAKIEHLPKNKVASSIEDEFGNITSYWYSNDWKNKGRAKNKPVQYPAFGYGGLVEDEDGKMIPEVEIYVGKPYQAGKEYYANPTYFAALPYANLEEEIANFYISHAKNGMSFGTVINVPNSNDWTEDVKRAYESKLKSKISGSSKAGEIIVSFNSDNADAITVDNVENNNAHKQWDFLVSEAKSQLLTAHRAISPTLVGITSTSGFSSTADEIEVSFDQLTKLVIQPKRDFIIDSYEEILDFFKLDIKGLYYRPLTEQEGEKEEEIKVDETVESVELGSSELDKFIAMGEIIDPLSYDLIHQIEVDYEEEESLQLASTGTARPNAKSSQDGEDFIVRYKYVGNPKGEREFCNKMIQAGKVYRKEDILQMGNRPVNKGFGMDGADTYSIWKYKGGGLLSKNFPGGTCKHKWNRVIYLKKGKNVDVNSPLAKTISTSEARRKGLKIETNESIVSIAPHDVK